MYRFNVYENYNNNNEFRFLTTYGCYGANREDAKAIAFGWAKATYPDKNISVMSVN